MQVSAARAGSQSSLPDWLPAPGRTSRSGRPAHQPRAGSVTPAPTSKSPPSLDDEFTHNGEVMSLRLIYLHMIEEYARHLGHADLLREQIDGTTGE